MSEEGKRGEKHNQSGRIRREITGRVPIIRQYRANTKSPRSIRRTVFVSRFENCCLCCVRVCLCARARACVCLRVCMCACVCIVAFRYLRFLVSQNSFDGRCSNERERTSANERGVTIQRFFPTFCVRVFFFVLVFFFQQTSVKRATAALESGVSTQRRLRHSMRRSIVDCITAG